MWKCVGVASLWGLLIAVPHFGAKVVGASFAGALGPISASAAELDDPPEGASVAEPGGAPAGPAEAPAAQAVPSAAPSSEHPIIPAAFASIHLENKLGKTLALVQARVTMDGKELPVVGNLKSNDDRVLFAGRVSPGPHVVDTRLICRGNRHGLFTYVNDYKWDLASKEVLTVPQDRAVVFTISAVRNKGINVPLNKQIGIAVHDEVGPSPFKP